MLTMNHFTRRERQVLELLSAGAVNKDIGEVLGIGVETVKEHVYNIMRKTGIHNRVQLAVWFVENRNSQRN